MMVTTRSAAGLVLKHNRRTLLFHHSGRGHRHDEITAAKAVRRPPEVHLVAPSRFGAQTQSARLTFSPFCAPTPPRRNYRREAVRRPPEVHLVAPSRFGAQTQSARLTFSPFWAPTPPSEKFPRRGLKWSRGSWAAYRWYLEGTLRVPRRSPGGLYITQR